MIPVDPKKPIEVVVESEKDLPKEQQTTFKVLPVLTSEAMDFAVEFGDGKSTVDLGDVGRFTDFVVKHLVGWKNFVIDGKEALFYRGSDAKKNIDYFTAPQLFELIQAIIATAGLTEAQVGN